MEVISKVYVSILLLYCVAPNCLSLSLLKGKGGYVWYMV